MYSITMSTPTASASTSSSTGKNLEQYHYPPIATLRRASRPSNIDLSHFDHRHTQQSNDPAIYSAPICHPKPAYNNHNHHHHPQQHIQQSSHPYTATFPYQSHQQMPLPSHHPPPQQQTNAQVYQQHQQPMLDAFPQHQHTPHTFPLQASPNHHHQYFYFPPSAAQTNATSNGHPATANPNNRLHAVQIQEQQQQQWSNPVLSPMMVKRMNESAASLPIDDDDEDPSASIDALVADVDSNSQDLLDHSQDKSLTESKTTSATTADPRYASPNLYHRSTSHILTTPPNPLASDDHPDNQLTMGNNFQKTFSPLPSAGFELTSTGANSMKMSSSNLAAQRTFFNFDNSPLEQTQLKTGQHSEMDNNNHEKPPQSLLRNADARTSKISPSNLIQDDNSNHSSTNSSSHHAPSRMLSQMFHSSEQRRSVSSSPLSTDVKLSSMDPGNNSTNVNGMALQQPQNGHLCTHPECNKVFTNKSALAKHKLTHSQDRKHKCLKCNKGFKRLDHLHGHMLTHEEEKPHKCRVPGCTRTYCDARSLKRHIENSHQDVLAAIHEGGNHEYRSFLPETAFVKAKDMTIHSEFSIDSVDSNSPRSLIDNEQSFNIRSAAGGKVQTTYTFDEEKYVECQICKKTFKSGAALNGHMRLHGGFNEKQPSPSSTDSTPKKKRIVTPATTAPKRKRMDSPSTSASIKTEVHDASITPSTDNHYYHNQLHSQHSFDRSSSSRSRSASSSTIASSMSPFPSYTIKNPLSVQPPPPASVRRPSPLSMNGFDPSRINVSNGLIQVDLPGHYLGFPNMHTSSSQYDETPRKVASSENYTQNSKVNGAPSPHSYGQPSPHPHPPHVVSLQLPLTTSIPSTSLPAHILQHLLRQKVDQHQQNSRFLPPSTLNDPIRRTPPSSTHIGNSALPNLTPLIANIPIPSPHSTFNASQPLPSSSAPSINSTSPETGAVNGNVTQPSLNAPKKRFLIAVKQEEEDAQQLATADNEPAVLTIVPDLDSPVRKGTSGFLIGTSPSTGTNSSASSSSQTHFNYDNILPPPPPQTNRQSTPSSFQWPSQFRRQLSLNTGKPILNTIPTTPYTPPPMLSPFRKGPGLYYRVFSQPGTAGETSSIPTTPILPFTPGGEESAGPKINIGREYQAAIPKLRTHLDDQNAAVVDELLFSPFELTEHDEKSLEKFEQLNRMNPFLFSPRHAPASYPLELVYMLLHEYNGNLPRTLASLLEGTARDIKQCRPLHHYRFPECDIWTKEETDAFSMAIQTSEKNFVLVSRAVRTKTVKQCIEFYYMPKVDVSARKLFKAGTSSVMTRRKRFQMIKSKQQQEDEASSSPFNDYRLDEENSLTNSDSAPTTQYTCDIAGCSQTFPSKRAYRAHRKEHRHTTKPVAPLTSVKRGRPFDSNK